MIEILTLFNTVLLVSILFHLKGIDWEVYASRRTKRVEKEVGK